MIVRTILSGADLITIKPTSSPLQNLEDDIDFAAMVPMQVETTLANPETRSRFARIKQVIIGGAAVSPTLEQRLQELPTRCYGTYGMTETVSHIALREINGERKSPAYFALGKVSFSMDKRGCLIINTPHLQQQRFITNDIVQLVDTTHFEWLGRHDNVINSGGVKLFPESIEARIASFLSQRFFITAGRRQSARTKSRACHRIAPLGRGRMSTIAIPTQILFISLRSPQNIYFQEHLTETYSGKIVRKIK